jgi:hypothetical protein
VGVFGRWLRAWWDNPLFRQTDPERVVPAATVPLWAWPMLRGRIEEAGIHVEAAEESRYPGSGSTIVPMTNIICRAQDRDEVVRIVDELLDTEDAPTDSPDSADSPDGSG